MRRTAAPPRAVSRKTPEGARGNHSPRRGVGQRPTGQPDVFTPPHCQSQHVDGIDIQRNPQVRGRSQRADQRVQRADRLPVMRLEQTVEAPSPAQQRQGSGHGAKHGDAAVPALFPQQRGDAGKAGLALFPVGRPCDAQERQIDEGRVTMPDRKSVV